MNAVPEGIVQHILSQMNNARDIASCTCVSKRFKESIPYLPSLYFPRNSFDGLPYSEADASISRMVLSAVHLEELVIYCPFSAASLASWLSLRSSSLRRLELRMDSIADKKMNSNPNKLDCIDCIRGLESLKLWGVCLVTSPKWSSFLNLHTLEIVGANLKDGALLEAIRACPNLKELALLGCEGATTVIIELEKLENCRLDFLGLGHCSLLLTCPMIQALDVQGFTWIRVNPNHHLRSVSISKVTGRVYKVDMGKLEELDFLSLRGIQWSWHALNSILRCASEVKHLLMKVEFCGDFERLQPFPQIDLVEFFNNHPKLRYFEMHGAMFAALCQRDSLRNLGSNFTIAGLEETTITVRSPLNAEQKLNTLESLIKYSRNLQKMVIRISQMRNCQDTADEFFDEICKFAKINNKVVRIE